MKVSKQADDLKRVMRQLPYPVTIVTAADGSVQRGITIGSFTSVSLDPPLVSFNVEKEAQMHELLVKATHFSVHIPETSQTDLCTNFSIPDQSAAEQFDQLDYTYNSYGTPVLPDVVAAIHCKKYTSIEAGDHSIFIGEVLEIDLLKEDAAVLYLNGSYRSIDL